VLTSLRIVQHLCGVLARLSLLEKVFNVFNLRVSNMKQAEGACLRPLGDCLLVCGWRAACLLRSRV
jgi:hypothetical protein